LSSGLTWFFFRRYFGLLNFLLAFHFAVLHSGLCIGCHG
jgi:hypothetical protein